MPVDYFEKRLNKLINKLEGAHLRSTQSGRLKNNYKHARLIFMDLTL